jgi:hypothetical protein
VIDNLPQIVAVSAHQYGRELISHARWTTSASHDAQGAADAAASMQAVQEQNKEANAETNAGIAAVQQTEINSGM